MANQNWQTLDLVNVIPVSILPTPAVLGTPNLNIIVIFTAEQPSGWSAGQTYGVYTNDAGPATDFGANSSVAAMATAVFAQTPNPVDTDGRLIAVPLLTSPSLETVRAAIDRVGDSFPYYGVLIDNELAGSNPTEFAALVAKVHAAGKMIGYASSNVNDLSAGSALDLVRQASEFRGRMLYYGTALKNGAGTQQTQIFAAAYLGRALSTNFGGVGTAITMHGKPLAGITPDQTVGQAQLDLATAAGIDVYVSIAGIPSTFTSGANQWFDQVYYDDWFSNALQVAGFNYLMPNSFKVPQTEDGMNGLKDAYRAVCEQAKRVGILAPGTWTGAVPAGLPQKLFQQNIQNVGYYVYSTPVASQSATDRSGRKAPAVQIAAKLAGAIQSSSVLVQMQQ